MYFNLFVAVILKPCQYDAIVLVKSKRKVKFTLKQEMKAQIGSRSIALLFFKPRGIYGGGCHRFCTITYDNKRPPKSQA